MWDGEREDARWVRISGLQSAAGQKLNGKVGEVLSGYGKPDADGRFQIKIDGNAAKGKLIKASNFADVPHGELVKAVRLPAVGEREVPEVLLFPRDHSMFHTCNPRGDSNVMALVGVPLVVQKVEPYVEFLNKGDATNLSATALLIDPHSGMAPPNLEKNMGPALIYRPGGLPLSYADIVVILDFMSKLHAKYEQEEPPFDPHTWLNQRNFEIVVRAEKKHEKNLATLNILK